ncbi:MAG: SiaB family protein kinase [Bacteroidia bacterium]
MKDIYKLYEYLRDEKICLSYLGLINDSITDKFIDLSEFFLKNSTHLGKIKNKTSFLIAECFQNVVKHGEKEITGEKHKDYFQINAWDGGVVLSSCNLVQEKYVTDLQKKIAYINSLGTDELKKLHDEVLTSEGFSNRGGAGLGLIDMARKTGLPLRYNFTAVENNVSEFFLALEIINQTEAIHVPKISLYLKKEMEFYRSLVEKNILLLYRGEFAQETMAPLIEMMEHNLIHSDSFSSKEKRKLVTIVEVLQNISKHGKNFEGNKAGIFSIGMVNGTFVIESGNFIDNEEGKSLKKSLDEINAMSMDEIVKLYKQRLLAPEISAEGNSGLGLLEIARNCSKQFTYSFIETPELETFFSIKVNLK